MRRIWKVNSLSSQTYLRQEEVAELPLEKEISTYKSILELISKTIREKALRDLSNFLAVCIIGSEAQKSNSFMEIQIALFRLVALNCLRICFLVFNQKIILWPQLWFKETRAQCVPVVDEIAFIRCSFFRYTSCQHYRVMEASAKMSKKGLLGQRRFTILDS